MARSCSQSISFSLTFAISGKIMAFKLATVEIIKLKLQDGDLTLEQRKIDERYFKKTGSKSLSIDVMAFQVDTYVLSKRQSHNMRP